MNQIDDIADDEEDGPDYATRFRMWTAENERIKGEQ
jgi:hypothetical protein